MKTKTSTYFFDSILRLRAGDVVRWSDSDNLTQFQFAMSGRTWVLFLLRIRAILLSEVFALLLLVKEECT